MQFLMLSLVFVIVAILTFGAVCGGKKKPTLTPPKPAEQPEEVVVIEDDKIIYKNKYDLNTELKQSKIKTPKRS